MSATVISPLELERLRAAGADVDLYDVRTPGEFEAVHAVGARSLPLDRLDADELVRDRPGDRAVYFICKGGMRAAKACEAVRAAGFANVHNVEGGTDEWVAVGLPVVRGARRVMSLERQVRIGAGVLVLVGVGLGALVHPWLYALAAFVGAGLVFAGVTDTCGMGMVLARMPWNRGGGGGGAGGGSCESSSSSCATGS